MSDGYIVDTSVFVRWWVNQAGWERARKLRSALVAGSVAMATPDFTRIELTEVMRKLKTREPSLSGLQLADVARSLDVIGVEVVTLGLDDVERAAALASLRSLRVFDALAAALALDRGRTLLTADAKSARALAGLVDIEVLAGVG